MKKEVAAFLNSLSSSFVKIYLHTEQWLAAVSCTISKLRNLVSPAALRVTSSSWFIWLYLKRVLLFLSYYSCYISYSKHKQIVFNGKGQVSQICTQINVKAKRKAIAVIDHKGTQNCGRFRPCSKRSFHKNVWALYTHKVVQRNMSQN